MTMSFNTIVTLLLLSCLGATGTALGVTEEPPQEGGVKAVPEIKLLVIEEIHWLMTQTSTTVKVCAKDDLPVGAPTLAYNYGIDKSSNLEGVIDSEPRCALFTQNATYKIDENPSRYELIVTDTSDPIAFIGRGSTTFAITVITTLLTCGNSHITKVTWSEKETLSDFHCIPGSTTSDKACYHDGDITGTELCFVVKDGEDVDVTVCLNGPIDNIPPPIAPISSNYFYYGPEAGNNVAADATLSLTMATAGLTNMRAIVWQAEDPPSTEAIREAHVYDCTMAGCTFTEYERTLATNEVCLDAMDSSLATVETATTSFTDLKLYAFDGGSKKSMLLECVFANGLTDMKYTANLLDNLPEAGVDVITLSTTNIDCTGVSADHACFGYLDTGTSTGTVYVTVSDTDSFNTIIVPFTIPVIQGLRRE